MYKYVEHLCLPVRNETTYLFTFILYLLKHTVPTDTEENNKEDKLCLSMQLKNYIVIIRIYLNIYILNSELFN